MDIINNIHVVNFNGINGFLACMLASSAVDHVFEQLSGQTIDDKIGICCFSAKHTALRTNIKDWLLWNQDNVSEWHNMYTCGLLFEGTSGHHHFIECGLFSP